MNNDDDNAIPEPGSAELEELVKSAAARGIYSVLYANRDKEPLTVAQIRERLDPRFAGHSELGRRVRDLDAYYDIERVRVAGGQGYRLRGRRTDGAPDTGRITPRLRAQVLHRAGGRCEMCGRSISQEGVVLVIDHITPRHWGGATEPDNLQALCTTCNHGKKAYFEGLSAYGDRIAQVMNLEGVHRRLGETLKVFWPEPAPSEVLTLVARQRDWPRRIRELRDIGWRFHSVEAGSAYQLDEPAPWPEGSIREAIARANKQKCEDPNEVEDPMADGESDFE